MADVATPISPPMPEGNGIHPEHPLAQVGEVSFVSTPGNSNALPSPMDPRPVSAADPAMSKAVDNVLYSDIGINALLNRLKQSIASARDLSIFLKKRSIMEEEHANHLRRLSKTTIDGLRSRDARQGSYAGQFEEVVRIHERMAENGTSFYLNAHQMSTDLEALAHDMERGRKHWKQTASASEQRVQEAERAHDRAKQKYDQLAEDYDRAKTGDKLSGRHFMLKTKSAAQQEEDLQRKVDVADGDYQTKVTNAQQVREEIEKTSRPQAISAMLQLIQECDSAVSLQLQKYASFNEKLLLGNGLLISPLNDGDVSKKGIRDVVAQIDNDRDFSSYITSFTNQVPPRKEVKYQKHHTLMALPQPHMPYNSNQDGSRTSFQQMSPTQASPKRTSGGPPIIPYQPQQPLSDKLLPQQQSMPYSPDDYRSAPAPYSSPAGPGQPAPYGASPYQTGPGPAPYSEKQFSSPPQQPNYPPYGQQQTGNYPSQAPVIAPIVSSPLNPSGQRQSGGPPTGYNGPPPPSGPGGYGAPPGPGPGPQELGTQSYGGLGSKGPQQVTRPMFGIHLSQLMHRDQTPIPIVVYQCLQAVDAYGLDHLGIYRESGNLNKVAQLKNQFDFDAESIDLRDPTSFFNDIHIPATLLKRFLQDLPDPLLTKQSYREFLDAAATTDDTSRRDQLHATINGLPDPNYATLRALTLHLYRVVQHAEVNKMSAHNLATVFAPTLLGGPTTQVQDSTLQIKAVETILVNALQIFDDD